MKVAAVEKERHWKAKIGKGMRNARKRVKVKYEWKN